MFRVTKLFLVLFLIFAFNSAFADGVGLESNIVDSTPDADGWTLIWHDEFDAPTLNQKYWKYDVDGNGGGNNELQYYTDSEKNSFIENGSLVIRALDDGYNGRAYTSAKVRSKYLAQWKYGKFEVRAKLPAGRGMWPAIWMMPVDDVYGTWPLSGEIDIMEFIGQNPNEILGTLHYGDYWPNNKHSSTYYTSETPLNEDYHVFAIEWEPNKIQWFIDGKLYATKTPEDLGGSKWVWDQSYYLILNLAVGGNFPGDPDETTQFPQNFYIDYVRVFKRR